MRTTSRQLWILNQYAQTTALPGGTRHYELGRRLVERGWNVVIVGSAFHHPTRTLAWGSARQHMVIQIVDGVRFIWLPSRTSYRGNDLRRVWNMIEFTWRALLGGRRCFDEQVPRPNVVLGSSPHLLTPWAGLLLARRYHVPLILEVRDLWPETLVSLGVFGRRHPIVVALHVLEHFLYRRAERIVSLLPEAWRYFSQHGIPGERVTWIPNGVSLHRGKAQVGRDEPTPERPFTVMYVGAHGRANALDGLLEAAALLRTDAVRLVLVGEGPEKASLVEAAKQMSLENVEFREAVPKSLVGSILREADVAVALLEDSPLPSYGISLNKLFDYMAAGKPIVLAGKVAHNYVDIAQCGITLPPRDPMALAQAIRDLSILSDEARREMGARGRAYVEEHHDWDLLAERLAGMLDEVIAESRSKEP